MSGIYSITPFTQLDFPGHLACIVWFAGCNMRCKYCYNPEIVHGAGELGEDDLLRFLNKRIGLLNAVVISGGEATLFPELSTLLKKIKSLGFKIKLDTNGSRPHVVNTLLDQQLIDYLALDFKAPTTKFHSITGSKLRFKYFDQTLAMLCQQDAVGFEVRTTVHADLLSFEDIALMQNHLLEHGYKKTHYLQLFRDTGNTVGNIESPENRFPLNRIEELPLCVEIRH